MVVSGNIDRETTSQYNLTVEVREKTRRRKRDTEQLGFNQVTVIVQIRDDNDNAPKFVYSNDTGRSFGDGNSTYFGIVSDDADPFTPVVQVKVRNKPFF